ncbi:sensor histidine kinase [Cytobacillus pseudoceanisediminis]|uniref:ATP-binding protein n=1 Tax=Cytobacillus pseudoceanisediminis TaxID=3051614 RepID=UPI00216186C4|nr:sensor histidine kinase [Cytobacillus firmus]
MAILSKPFKFKQPGLFGQMVLLVLTVLLICILLIIISFSSIIDQMIEKTTGQQALTVAELVAENDSIIDAFNTDHPAQLIQPIAEKLRERTGADYIVIANGDGIRYSHPYPNQIGRVTETSNKAPLAGDSIVFIGNGVLGEAVKAKTPIYDKSGKIIGVSSVGFLTNEVEGKIFVYQLRVAGFGGLALLIGIPGAFYIARRVKKLIFNLEPEEISHAFSEKQAILESIGDATLAISPDLKILSANKKARGILGEHAKDTLTELHLKALIQNALENPNLFIQKQVLINNSIYIVDISPIQAEETAITGFVLTIRPFSEVEDLANELIEIRQHANHIRAQTHEYLNKLNTLNGLLLLERYEEAKALMKMEVQELQQTVTFLMSTIKDPLIVALLLGKVNRAKEMKVLITFDENSQWLDFPDTIQSEHVVTVVGNLIDNALEASSAWKGKSANVHLSFTDYGDELIMDIEDNGKGMTSEEEAYFFTEGATTKNDPQHGLGLTIMQHALSQLGGEWYRTDRSEGTCMTIAIPKANPDSTTAKEREKS